MSLLAKRIVSLHKSLAKAGLPHAFGGALALAWCTERARGTIDIDVNVFVSPEHLDDLLAALPKAVRVRPSDRDALLADGQARVWWDKTPVDVFLNTTAFHEVAASRLHWEQFGGASVPFLACRDLAVFKAFFNRTKDWADLEEMHAAGRLDMESVLGVLALYLGGDDDRVARLRQLAI